MSSDATTPSYRSRRQHTFTGTPLPPADPGKPPPPMSVAGTPGRTLPPLVQQPGNNREPVRYRTDHVGSQLSLPRGSSNTTQQRPAIQPYPSSLISPSQYNTAISSTSGLTRSPYTSPVDLRAISNSVGPRSKYENSSMHSNPTQSAYGGRKLQPSEDTFRSSTNQSSSRGPAGQPRESFISNTQDLTPSQRTSTAKAPAQPQHNAQDM